MKSLAMKCSNHFFGGGRNAINAGCLMKIESKDGTIKTIGNTVIVEDATEAVIYLSSCTDFRHKDFEKECHNRVNAAIMTFLASHTLPLMTDYSLVIIPC